MALDLDRLRAGLDQYRQTLERQREQLRVDYSEVQQLFDALWSEYAGNLAEELQLRWQHTAEWLEHYLNKTQELDQFLGERLEYLRKL